jgi:DNA-directed RNA polymerase specialized sigma24 family protein
LSYADIAAATGTSTETVKSRLRYARKKLAYDLEEELRNVEL